MQNIVFFCKKNIFVKFKKELFDWIQSSHDIIQKRYIIQFAKERTLQIKFISTIYGL